MQLPQAAINAAYDSKYNRFIITPFYLTNHLVLMANIYAPSGNQKERDEFFKHFNTQLDSEIKKFATTIDPLKCSLAETGTRTSKVATKKS